MDQGQYKDVDKFSPSAFKCVECDHEVSMFKDSYIRECCGVKVTCYACFGNFYSRLSCKGCKGENILGLKQNFLGVL